MKKLFLLMAISGIIVSCAKDECTELVTGVSTQKSIQGKSVIDLSGLTSDVTLNPSDATSFVITTTGDVNLNGFTLTVKNVQLNISGNLNGGGTLKTQGANGAYCLVNGGSIQNNPNLSNAVNSCQSLSTGPVSGAIQKEIPCGATTFRVGGIEYTVIRN